MDGFFGENSFCSCLDPLLNYSQNSSYYVNRAMSNFGDERGEEKFALATKELHKKTRPERTTPFILISCFNSTT